MYFWQVISGNDFDIHVVARSFVTGRRYRSHCSASCSDVPKNLSHGMGQADDISNFVTDVTNLYNRMYLFCISLCFQYVKLLRSQNLKPESWNGTS